MHIVGIEPTFASWRAEARVLLSRGVLPEHVVWHEESGAQASLLAVHSGEDICWSSDADNTSARAFTVPRAFVSLAGAVACHADPGRWDALYRILFRLTRGEPSLLEVATDPDVYRVTAMERAIKRAVHKMHAFVRFRAVESEDGALSYVAWFEPVHNVVERAAGLFMRRFASMRWSILTPLACAHWDGNGVQFTPGVSRDKAPSEDELEELWRSYYAHIFNPARVSIGAMQAEMPKQYWANLPEARLIPALTREAPQRVARMLAQLDAPAAELPDELRSRVGDALVPERARAVVAERPSIELDIPGAWDPTPDPGVRAARDRSDRARPLIDGHVSESRALTCHDVPLRVGTASWTDPTLLQPGVFYPDDVRTPEERLRFYASRYRMVEVDATYYVPPTRAMAAAWTARTPDDFVFDVKAYALMTGHGAETKRMPDWLRRQLPRSVASAPRVYARDLPVAVVDDVWERFMGALAPLDSAGKLGPVLLQFPRWFAPTRESADALRAARARLGNAAAAVEFRNPEWVSGRIAPRTVALLEQLQFTYVCVDAPPGTASSMPPVVQVTTPELAIVRLHGRRTAAWEATHQVVSERYRYLYDGDELGEWRERIAGLAARLQETASFPDMARARQGVHVVFNNCHASYGTTNADEITALLIEFDRER